MIFKDLKDSTKALDCLKTALRLYDEYFKKENNLNSAFCLNNLGMVYRLVLFHFLMEDESTF